ncbi:hypothetical protein [Streptomyces sp. NPDC051452]|uniref:hypothetical protein n=1 Tax=Streptomyces sp. NPDC051452 TaxID=3365654 RepID=UPI0037AE27F9
MEIIRGFRTTTTPCHDALPRRLREPGGPHREGAPKGEEFTLARRAVLEHL